MIKLVACIMGQNASRTLQMCFESVRNADAIVYCDGGSTDETFRIIEHMERAKNKTKEDVAVNVNEVLLPLLERLKLEGVTSKYIDLIKDHLEKLASPFGREIVRKSVKLTPREIEICSMLRGNLSSKEISQLLTLSPQTIDKHRKNIRKKLGISKKKVNLISYLQKI